MWCGVVCVATVIMGACWQLCLWACWAKKCMHACHHSITAWWACDVRVPVCVLGVCLVCVHVPPTCFSKPTPPWSVSWVLANHPSFRTHVGCPVFSSAMAGCDDYHPPPPLPLELVGCRLETSVGRVAWQCLAVCTHCSSNVCVVPAASHDG